MNLTEERGVVEGGLMNHSWARQLMKYCAMDNVKTIFTQSAFKATLTRSC